MTSDWIVVILGKRKWEAWFLQNTDADSLLPDGKWDRHNRRTFDFAVLNGDQGIKGKFQGTLDGAVKKAVTTFLKACNRQGLTAKERVVIWEPKGSYMELVPQSKIEYIVKETVLEYQNELCDQVGA